MYNIIKDVIGTGKYDLNNIVKKIEKRNIEGTITDEQRDELLSLARQTPDPMYTYRSWQENSQALWQEIEALKAEVRTLVEDVAELKGEEPPEAEEPEPDKYLPFVQPTGAHNAYNTGDGVTENGEKFESLMDGNVWAPSAYPAGWKKVTE